ncbi:hypothetical protein D9M72_578680 [compost metagenome]
MPAGRFLSSSEGLPETSAALAGFDLSAVSPSTLAFSAAAAFAVAGVFTAAFVSLASVLTRAAFDGGTLTTGASLTLFALAGTFFTDASGVVSVVGPPSGAENTRSICGPVATSAPLPASKRSMICSSCSGVRSS